MAANYCKVALTVLTLQALALVKGFQVSNFSTKLHEAQ